MRIAITVFSLFFSLYSLAQQKRTLDSLTYVLEKTYQADQEPRKAIDSIAEKHGYDSEEMRRHWKETHTTDSLNLITVTSILDKYGWLSAAETSEKANEALFLTVQHADLATQLKYLPALRTAVISKKAKSSAYAYLLDRTNIGQGKFQIYGSQYHIGRNGKMQLYPIRDEPQINQRRKAVGLSPLEVYAKEIGLAYKVPQRDWLLQKLVVIGMLADTLQKPLIGAEVLSGKTVIAKTDSFGQYTAILDEKDRAGGITFQKEGYKPFTFPLNEGKQLYEFMFLLRSQTKEEAEKQALQQAIEDQLFPGGKLSQGYRFKFTNKYKEVFISTADGIRLHGLLFKVTNSKGLILYLHGSSGALGRVDI